MLRYLSIYKKLISLSFSTWIAYRANFINTILGSMSWGVFGIVSILLLTARTSSVYGWTRDELLLLAGAYGVVVGIFHTLFSRNFENMSKIIDYGQLDPILLLPVDSQFIVSVRSFGFGSMMRVLFSLGIVIYVLQKMHIPINLVNIFGFTVLTIVGVMLLYSMWFIVMTGLIWFTRLSNMVDFMFTITGISRFPREIIRGTPYFIFLFLLPFTLIVTTPSKALLNKSLEGDVYLLTILAVVMFLISRWFWKYALRSYTSASS